MTVIVRLYDFVKEGFDAVIYFSEVFVGVAKVYGIPLDFKELVAIEYLSVVELIGIVGFGENVLDD